MITGILGCIEQQIAIKLRESPMLLRSDIVCEEEEGTKNLESKGNGLKIIVEMPEPLEALQYSALPTFTKISVGILVEKSFAQDPSSPSISLVCEEILRRLHGAVISIDGNSSSIRISSKTPWTPIKKNSYDSISQKTAIRILFQTQASIHL